MAGKCIDSGTQVMTTTQAGERVLCGNCGASVQVREVPLNSDPQDHNTIRVVADH